ncbi:MAG: hypothetical protein CSA89_01410 [Bacteroidales bacterium]|nr:MAG: hypothetical protein CSA89_01410 [Bacteroidales bacterium]
MSLRAFLSNIRVVFFIAWRYLFSHKSQNAINVISAIAVIGVSITTAALVCVLSVFNGFVDIIEDSLSALDADLQITIASGKVFDYKAIEDRLQRDSNILVFSQSLEDDALISYNDNQTPFRLRGVDSCYNKVFDIDGLMQEGAFRLYSYDFDLSIVGIGLASKLNLGVDYVNGITIYVPQRQGRINTLRPDEAFKKGELFVSGLFATNQMEIDENILIVPIDFARKMYDYNSSMVSAINIKIKRGQDIKAIQQSITNDIGDKYEVRDRFEQHQDYFKIIKTERLLVFVILLFMLFIAICNVVASLSMVLLEKQYDIQTLKHLGIKNSRAKAIFFVEGWIMAIIGTVIGVIGGIAICYLQYKFGFITMSDISFVEKYPISIKVYDIFIIALTVLTIGFLASWITVVLFFRHKKKSFVVAK